VGGSGSGNTYGPTVKKAVVEACRCLDVKRLTRAGILKPGVWLSGSVTWFRDRERKEAAAAIGYEVDTMADQPWLRLSYTLTGTGEAINYIVPLAVTRPYFGGLRRWFRCPLPVSGVACGRRVAKLYLHGRYFGCRHCHRLTYTSCQESGKDAALYRFLARQNGWDWHELKRVMASTGKRPS
jgi:hypothetical protein